MKEGRLPKRQYTEEFKAEAVRLAASVGGHGAARRLGVPVATLGNSSRRGIASAGATGTVASPSEAPARRPVSELEAENSRLRRELAEAKLDVEILQKATAYGNPPIVARIETDRLGLPKTQKRPGTLDTAGFPA